MTLRLTDAIPRSNRVGWHLCACIRAFRDKLRCGCKLGSQAGVYLSDGSLHHVGTDDEGPGG